MGLFSPIKSSKSSGKKREPVRRDAFDRYGWRGTMSSKRLSTHLRRVPLSPQQREYVRRVMERYDERIRSRGVTREEFHKGLDEMAKNSRDPISRREVETIKKYFR